MNNQKDKKSNLRTSSLERILRVLKQKDGDQTNSQSIVEKRVDNEYYLYSNNSLLKTIDNPKNNNGAHIQSLTVQKQYKHLSSLMSIDPTIHKRNDNLMEAQRSEGASSQTSYYTKGPKCTSNNTTSNNTNNNNQGLRIRTISNTSQTANSNQTTSATSNGYNAVLNQKSQNYILQSQKQNKSQKIMQKHQTQTMAMQGCKEIFETIYGAKPCIAANSGIKKKSKKQGGQNTLKKPNSRANSTQKRNIQEILLNGPYNKDPSSHCNQDTYFSHHTRQSSQNFRTTQSKDRQGNLQSQTPADDRTQDLQYIQNNQNLAQVKSIMIEQQEQGQGGSEIGSRENTLYLKHSNQNQNVQSMLNGYKKGAAGTTNNANSIQYMVQSNLESLTESIEHQGPIIDMKKSSKIFTKPLIQSKSNQISVLNEKQEREPSKARSNKFESGNKKFSQEISSIHNDDIKQQVQRFMINQEKEHHNNQKFNQIQECHPIFTKKPQTQQVANRPNKPPANPSSNLKARIDYQNNAESSSKEDQNMMEEDLLPRSQTLGLLKPKRSILTSNIKQRPKQTNQFENLFEHPDFDEFKRVHQDPLQHFQQISQPIMHNGKINFEISVRESLNESSIRLDKDQNTLSEQNDNKSRQNPRTGGGAPKSPSELISDLDSFPFFENCIPGANLFRKRGINQINIEDLQLKAMLQLMESKFN
ncbi:UNKNOWN [Stylonychia lemnae]|uniref:Uncharacterized protein n=1 Tax=Stylonychia lemnae TaxID=5949 RepID=A0A078B5L2_STYLE|nr:UNKNOWN [Stylonychia lemnae]|eukprot:CDW88808.1 UNKNOWN [Stylonychia lemnae]